MANKKHKVGLVGLGEGIGDSMFALKALYALKEYYNAEVIYLGGANTKELFSGFKFIDKYVCASVGSGWINDDYISTINSLELDFLILSVSRHHNVKLALASNAKKIVFAPKTKKRAIGYFFMNFLHSRFKLLYTHLGFWKNKSISLESLLLDMVKSINPSKSNKNLDFMPTRLCVDLVYKEHIDSFLGKEQKRFVMVVPFGVSSPFNLPIRYYIHLISLILSLPAINVVVPVYYKTKLDFLNACRVWGGAY